MKRNRKRVGRVCIYEGRDRDLSCTDTAGDTTETVYDKHNNVVKTIDAKQNEDTCRFDARDRRFQCTNGIDSVVDSLDV